MRAPSSTAERSRIKISRWARAELSRPVEHVADHEERDYTIGCSLHNALACIKSGNRIVVPSRMPAGQTFLQSPTADVRHGRFDTAYHILRIYLPADMIAECYEVATGRELRAGQTLFDPYPINDAVLAPLTRTLINVDEAGGALGPCFVDGIGIALAARLVALSLRRGNAEKKAASPLAKWRLKKVTSYVEENFAKAIYLNDLSRMHFAGQFRAAMGVTPHAYIVKRRIAAAQDLLLNPENSIAFIALEVGFSSQAHFSSTFKKEVGTSPRRWRSTALSH